MLEAQTQASGGGRAPVAVAAQPAGRVIGAELEKLAGYGRDIGIMTSAALRTGERLAKSGSVVTGGVVA